MTKILAIALDKDGIGMTTTGQHQGHALAMRGRRVLLMDI